MDENIRVTLEDIINRVVGKEKEYKRYLYKMRLFEEGNAELYVDITNQDRQSVRSSVIDSNINLGHMYYNKEDVKRKLIGYIDDCKNEIDRYIDESEGKQFLDDIEDIYLSM